MVCGDFNMMENLVNKSSSCGMMILIFFKMVWKTLKVVLNI